jgi:hypothetical protein
VPSTPFHVPPFDVSQRRFSFRALTGFAVDVTSSSCWLPRTHACTTSEEYLVPLIRPTPPPLSLFRLRRPAAAAGTARPILSAVQCACSFIGPCSRTDGLHGRYDDESNPQFRTMHQHSDSNKHVLDVRRTVRRAHCLSTALTTILGSSGPP